MSLLQFDIAPESCHRNRRIANADTTPTTGSRSGFSWNELAQPARMTVMVATALLVVRMFHLAHYPYPAMSAEAVAYGQTEAPFHVRLLTPMLTRGLLELTGVGSFTHWNLLVQFGFVSAAIVALFVWLREFFAESAATTGILLAPVALLWSIDMPAADAFPQVFFFTTAFILLHRRRYPTFFVVYGLAIMNRETAAVLVLPFLIQAILMRDGAPGRTARKEFALAAAAGMIGWAILWKLWLGPALSPAEIPNRLALFQFPRNAALFTDWAHTLNPFAKNPFTILGYFWLLVPFAWKSLPKFIKLLCLCWVPYFLLMLMVAKITETRVHMEWTPVALAVATAALTRVSPSSTRWTAAA
jgi:hypothetical protein